MSKKQINMYTGPKRLYFEFSLMSSSDDSEFDFEAFNSGQRKKEKKSLEPKLKRSKRQGMCLCPGDDTSSDSSQTEQKKPEAKNLTKDTNKKNNDSKNLIEIKEDKILDHFVKNFHSKNLIEIKKDDILDDFVKNFES